jgi:hypothetical protein
MIRCENCKWWIKEKQSLHGYCNQLYLAYEMYAKRHVLHSISQAPYKVFEIPQICTFLDFGCVHGEKKDD